MQKTFRFVIPLCLLVCAVTLGITGPVYGTGLIISLDTTRTVG